MTKRWTPPPLAGVCAACGEIIHGKVEWSIHRDGFGEGPEVPLCRVCGSDVTPTCEELWAAIRDRVGGCHEVYHHVHWHAEATTFVEGEGWTAQLRHFMSGGRDVPAGLLSTEISGIRKSLEDEGVEHLSEFEAQEIEGLGRTWFSAQGTLPVEGPEPDVVDVRLPVTRFEGHDVSRLPTGVPGKKKKTSNVRRTTCPISSAGNRSSTVGGLSNVAWSSASAVRRSSA